MLRTWFAVAAVSVMMYTVSFAAPHMLPGTGWTGATAQPANQGTSGSPGYTCKAIARWDVVQYQTIGDSLCVGVVAFHLSGIARVDFAAEGGAWVSATQMTYNPQSAVWEYWAVLKAGDFTDGKRELRAIAYPNTGVPRVLQDASGQDLGDKSLYVYANGHGTLLNTNTYVYVSSQSGNDNTGAGTSASPFRTILKAVNWLNTTKTACEGAVIYLMAGTYAYPDVPGDGAPNRWVTFQAAPGAAKADVVMTPALAGITQRKVKVKGLTLRQTTDGAILPLRSSPYNNHFWVDDCECIGRGYVGGTISTAGFVTLDNGCLFYTNCLLHDTQGINFSGTTLVRNCQTYNLGSDLIRCNTLVVNVSHRHTRINSGVHPDVVQYPLGSIDNFIIYGLKATDVVAQGFAVGDAANPQRNVAFVNVVMEQVPSDPEYTWVPAGSTVDHVLWWHVTFVTHTIQVNTDGQNNYSLRNCVIKSMSPGTSNIGGWIVDNNHYVTAPTTGTNATSGNPGYAAAATWSGDNQLTAGDYRPGATSVLRNRASALLVPIDVDGNVRVAPTAVGAYAGPEEAVGIGEKGPVTKTEHFKISILNNPDAGRIVIAVPSLSRDAALSICRIDGSLVRSWAVPAAQAASRIVWDRKDALGNPVRPGLYCARIDNAAGKIVLVR